MYFLVYHVKPDSDNRDDIGGAYVSCWIDSSTEQIAITEIKALKWNILEIDTCYEVKKKNLKKPGEIEFYSQALIDKWVLIFHTYPLEN